MYVLKKKGLRNYCKILEENLEETENFILVFLI